MQDGDSVCLQSFVTTNENLKWLFYISVWFSFPLFSFSSSSSSSSLTSVTSNKNLKRKWRSYVHIIFHFMELCHRQLSERDRNTIFFSFFHSVFVQSYIIMSCARTVSGYFYPGRACPAQANPKHQRGLDLSFLRHSSNTSEYSQNRSSPGNCGNSSIMQHRSS